VSQFFFVCCRMGKLNEAERVDATKIKIPITNVYNIYIYMLLVKQNRNFKLPTTVNVTILKHKSLPAWQYNLFMPTFSFCEKLIGSLEIFKQKFPFSLVGSVCEGYKIFSKLGIPLCYLNSKNSNEKNGYIFAKNCSIINFFLTMPYNKKVEFNL